MQDHVSGMTINERLGHFKLFEAFDSAVASRRQERVVAVLLQAHLTEAEVSETAAAVLANPARYGYE
jgi:hypothetical protein